MTPTEPTLCLVLEDDPERVSWLLDQVPDCARVIVADNVTSFAKHLKQYEPNLVLLDHDLGDHTDPGSAALEHIPDEAPYPIIIWSVNPVGAQRMLADLQRKQCVVRWFPCMGDRKDLTNNIRALLA